MPLKTAGHQKVFSSFRRVTQAAAFIASLYKHYPQRFFGIYSFVEFEPVYWHGYPEIVYPSVSCRHYFHSCPQVIAMEVSFRLCHGLAGKACGGQWACTDGLYTSWVTESDNLSNITLICNLIPQHYQKGDDYVHFIFAATRQRSPESYFGSHKISVWDRIW